MWTVEVQPSHAFLPTSLKWLLEPTGTGAAYVKFKGSALDLPGAIELTAKTTIWGPKMMSGGVAQHFALANVEADVSHKARPT